MNFSQFIYTSMVCLLLMGGRMYGQKDAIPLRLKVSTDLVFSQTIRDPSDGQVLAGGNSLSNPSVALMMPGFRAQDLQEISLLIPTYAQANTPIQLSLGLGYQYNWVFTPNWEKLKLYLGGGVQVSYFRYDNDAGGAFPPDFMIESINALTTSLRLAPGAIYELSDRFFLNVELPLDVISLRMQNEVVQQTFRRRAFTFSTLGDFLPIRMGFGAKF